MQKWVIPLNSAFPENLVGRKAAVLGRLIETGFPVPNSVCITTEAFNAATAKGHGELHLASGILSTLSDLLPMDLPLVVRSSAVQEDMPETSLAGRFSTILNVTGTAALERAILECWHSYFTVPSDKEAGGMAVLIQPLLDAECAGVCFSVDPVRLEPENLLIASSWCLGQGVVSGTVPTDTARLCRFDLRVEEISIANKHHSVRPGINGGISLVPTSSQFCNIPCLPDGWLRRIGEYGLAIEQVFGVPQDIEWTIANGKVWILQSRPVTAIPVEIREAVQYLIHWDNEEEPRHYWWLVQAGDSAGNPALPAMLDFTRQSIQGGHDAVYFGGGSRTRWRKEVNGRAYWTVASSPNSPGHQRVYSAALQEFYDRLRQADVTPWEYSGHEIINATKRLESFNASEADAQALADHLEDAVATSIRHWMQHTMGPTRPIGDAELLNAYACVVGRPPEEVASEIPFLLTGTETIQTRLVESLYDLACLAQEFPDEAKAIVLGDVKHPTNFSKHEALVFALQGFLAEYGSRLCYRQVPGYPVEIPLPWREFPEHIWEMISAYLPLAQQGGPSPRAVREQTRNALDQHVEALCTVAAQAGIASALLEEFRRKLSYARRNAFSLDEHNHYIDQLSEGQFVQALIHAGRWLSAQGRLPNPFDVFWLNTDEVLAALRDSSNGLDPILSTRRKQFADWQSLLPPAILGLPTPQLPERPESPGDTLHISTDQVNLAHNSLKGEPASRGSATGRARLSDGNTLPASIEMGDILVAPFASPGVIPLLPAITGVVLDFGGPGDHFAITAREFGLPAICGTIHATRLIPENAQVTIDTESGLVTWK